MSAPPPFLSVFFLPPSSLSSLYLRGGAALLLCTSSRSPDGGAARRSSERPHARHQVLTSLQPPAAVLLGAAPPPRPAAPPRHAAWGRYRPRVLQPWPQRCSGPPRSRVPELRRDTPLGAAAVATSSSSAATRRRVPELRRDAQLGTAAAAPAPQFGAHCAAQGRPHHAARGSSRRSRLAGEGVREDGRRGVKKRENAERKERDLARGPHVPVPDPL